jgi:hypothetical protein
MGGAFFSGFSATMASVIKDASCRAVRTTLTGSAWLFEFQIAMPTKRWLQLPTAGERKKGRQSVAYEFRTDLVEP